jgi:hypothetical protein
VSTEWGERVIKAFGTPTLLLRTDAMKASLIKQFLGMCLACPGDVDMKNEHKFLTGVTKSPLFDRE